MAQLIEEPTRITRYTETLLNPIVITNPEKCSSRGTLNTDIFTGHRPTFWEISFNIMKYKQKPLEKKKVLVMIVLIMT